MKVTVETTPHFIDVTAGKARIWRGVTESGRNVILFVKGVGVVDGEDMAEFINEFGSNTPFPLPVVDLPRAILE